MAERNRNGLMRPNHEGTDDSVSSHHYRRLTPAEVQIIEDRIASQSREIQTLLQNNQGLAATHVALKQDVAAAQQDLRHLSATASSIKAARDAQVREVYERSLKLEAEARSFEGLSAELDRVRAEIKELREERMGLSEKLKDIECDISSTQPELQELSDLKTEIEAWQREIRRGRVAIDYERKMQSKNFELGEAMEKHIISMANEAEMLHTKLGNAEQRATAAVVGAVPAPNHGNGYAIQQPGYANAIQHPGYANAIQQPGYYIQQPGYGENSLSDPHAVQPGYGRNTLFDPHVAQQPGYPINTLSDPHVAQQPEYGENSLSDAQHVLPGHGGNTLSDSHGAQQPGCGENLLSDAHVGQTGYGENSLSDVHVVQPGCGGNALSDPHVSQQPGYGENSLSAPPVVQPGCGGNTLFDPHVAHQLSGEHSNQKENVERNYLKRNRKSRRSNKKQKVETNSGGNIPKCADCQKNHRGKCLKGTKVCFKCKEPGHMLYECPALEEKEPKGKGKDGANALTQEEAKHVMKGAPICADCKKRHQGECLKGTKVCFKCRKPGHMSRECTAFEEKKLVGKEKAGVTALTQDGA